MIKAEWTNRDNLSIETTGQNNKAVLVIDMPIDCTKCPLANGYCWSIFPTRGKADGCPLRPLPQKKVPYFNPNANTYDEEKERSIMNEIDGYNRCIDEIVGDNDNEV